MIRDPGRPIQEAVIRAMSLEERRAVCERLAARGRALAWRQADDAGPMTVLQQAEFLVRRLHPSLPDAALRQVLDQLADAESRDEWGGFRRPEDLAENLAGR